MISRCKVAIFDMDGTLLESMRFWRFAALEYLLKKHMPISDKALAGVFHRSAGETIKIAYREAGLDEKDISPDLGKEILEIVKLHYEEDVFVKTGALEYVKKLRDQGIRCCVATATQKDCAEEVLEKLGFGGCFEFVYDTAEAGCSKAHEEYFRKLSEKLGVQPEECAMYEDALYSIRTAKKVGMTVVAIEDYCAANTKSEIMELADVYVKEFTDLL